MLHFPRVIHWAKGEEKICKVPNSQKIPLALSGNYVEFPQRTGNLEKLLPE